MDYIYGKDLMTFIRMKRNLNVEEIKMILSNILVGINECHKQKIIHRDIKPQNIIINIHTFSLKIIDFGLSINL
jgi:serine/threonine-protein kinase